MQRTRKERIDFIRENSPAHRDIDFRDYDDSDIFELYLTIPLPDDKERERNKEAGIGFYLWKKFGDWLIRDNYPGWLRGSLIVLWILLNPLCLIFYLAVAGVFTLIIMGH